MYDPFVSECINCRTQHLSFPHKIESISPFAPQLCFVDSHCRGDKDNGYPFETKPDISIYHQSLGDKVPASCDSSLIDVHIEFKRYTWDDPFGIPTTTSRRDSAFIAATPNKTNTLGQIGAYTTSQLASQFCTHCYSVYVNRDHACIIRWERDGAIVTEPIFYNIDSALVRFFSQYSQAPPGLCGIDTTISPASTAEAKLARSKLDLPEDTDMFQTTVPRTTDGLPSMVILPTLTFILLLPLATQHMPALHMTQKGTVLSSSKTHGVSMGMISSWKVTSTLNSLQAMFPMFHIVSRVVTWSAHLIKRRRRKNTLGVVGLVKRDWRLPLTSTIALS